VLCVSHRVNSYTLYWDGDEEPLSLGLGGTSAEFGQVRLSLG